MGDPQKHMNVKRRQTLKACFVLQSNTVPSLSLKYMVIQGSKVKSLDIQRLNEYGMQDGIV